MNSSSQRAVTPTKAQIGRAGELLVQTKLLLGGVESAQMTTDTGIDLVAYSAIASAAITIQVKSNLQPKPAGGKGKPHLGWWVPTDCPAELVAFVDLQESRVWIVRTTELPEVPLEPDPSNILKSQENIAEMPVQLSPIAASRSSERRHSGPDGAPTPPIAHLEVASTLTGQGIGPTLMAKMTLARRIPL